MKVKIEKAKAKTDHKWGDKLKKGSNASKLVDAAAFW